MSPKAYITQYYLNQAGGGGNGHFYAGSSYQKGYGIGSWLGGLFRQILPILRSGATAVGKQAVLAGSNVLADLAAGENASVSAKRRLGQAGATLSDTLKRKADAMSGAGRRRSIKRRKVAPKTHSVARARKRKTLPLDNYFS